MDPLIDPLRHIDLDSFIQVYRRLADRYNAYESALALINDVACYVLSRVPDPLPPDEAAPYFQAVLTRKGLFKGVFLYQDVDLPGHIHQGREALHLSIDDQDAPIDCWIDHDPRARLHGQLWVEQQLACLDDPLREAVYRKVIECDTLREIAEDHQVTTGVAWKRVHQGLGMLHERLQQEAV